jgi:hypothetical protein
MMATEFEDDSFHRNASPTGTDQRVFPLSQSTITNCCPINPPTLVP